MYRGSGPVSRCRDGAQTGRARPGWAHCLPIVPPDSVLVIDGEAIVLDVLASAIQSPELTVKTARRASDGMALLAAGRFACLLVSEQLPDGSGLAVVARALELQPHCACVVLTAFTNVDAMVQSLRQGAVDVLEKPVPQPALVQEKVAQALTRHRLAVERDALVRRVHALEAQPQRDEFVSSAQVVMLQEALDVARADHERALREVRDSAKAEVSAAASELAALKARHQRALAVLRQGAALVANALDSNRLPTEVDQDLRKLRRALSTALDEG